jgi:hypothetical protein
LRYGRLHAERAAPHHRARTLALAAPLSDEDAAAVHARRQPAKWHLAHTTWFFETLVLVPHLAGYRVFDERWPRLFNSYYEPGPAPRTAAARPAEPAVAWPRCWPTAPMDAALADLLPQAGAAARALIELGCHHEQQHQELLLTDILHAFSCNPLLPAYDASPPAPAPSPEQAWLKHAGGIVDIGHGAAAFAFDNEGPAIGLAGALRDQQPPRHLRRVRRLHRQRRLPRAAAVAVGRLGHRAGPGLAAARLLAGGRRVFGLHGPQPLDERPSCS